MTTRTQSEIKRGLTHSDGTFRDANYFGIDTDGLVALLDYLATHWTKSRFRISEDGIEGQLGDAKRALEEKKTLHAVFEGGPMAICSIQLFVGDSDSSYLVELSFFPDDIDTSEGIRPTIKLFEAMKARGGAPFV